jgi:nucleoside recognition membrane protein YjiH
MWYIVLAQVISVEAADSVIESLCLTNLLFGSAYIGNLLKVYFQCDFCTDL